VRIVERHDSFAARVVFELDRETRHVLDCDNRLLSHVLLPI